jgi:glycosyltransferase involved in cell wall biosynthesis
MYTMDNEKAKDGKEQKVNILYVSNQRRMLGGAERIIRDLIDHLDRSQFTPFFASIYDEELASMVKQSGVNFIKLNEFRRTNPLPYIFSQFQLTLFLLKNKINIVHNNQCQDAFYSWLPGRLTNTKMIIHHRDSSQFTKTDLFFINHVDCNICMSSWQNENYLNNKAILVYEGIDLDKVPIVLEDHQIDPIDRTQQGLVVGLAGRISPIKGQLNFINAAKIVLDEKPDTQFLIIGDTKSGYYDDYYMQLLNQIDVLGISGKVIFKGFTKNIHEIYPRLDISVVPSLREPFGMVLIEAMAFSKPVIATNVGGPLDIVTDQTGILVPVNDPDALAAAILKLIHDPQTRESMGKAGRKRVESFFTIERTLSKLYAIYVGLLSGNTREQTCRTIIQQ